MKKARIKVKGLNDKSLLVFAILLISAGIFFLSGNEIGEKVLSAICFIMGGMFIESLRIVDKYKEIEIYEDKKK